MKYKAIARGYDGVKLREVGEEFEYSGLRGSWMSPVGEAPKASKAAAHQDSKKETKEKSSKEASL